MAEGTRIGPATALMAGNGFVLAKVIDFSLTTPGMLPLTWPVVAFAPTLGLFSAYRMLRLNDRKYEMWALSGIIGPLLMWVYWVLDTSLARPV